MNINLNTKIKSIVHMKTVIFNLAMALFAGTMVFANPIEGDEKPVNLAESKITWKGYKVTGSHYGTIDLKSGKLVFDGDKLTGGEFEVDMTTLISEDLSGNSKTKLEGHLKSDDFFGVATYPSSRLVFTQVQSTGKNRYEVTGDLTIKDHTEQITFEISVYGSKATANLTIDRSKFDVRYGSGSFFENLGDKTIYDDFNIVADLVF